MQAQPASLFRIREYSTENGLPSNGIKGMQWDAAHRFLWLATEGGIARFNGMEFKNFTRDNTPGINSDRTLFIIRNRAGEILSADLDGSIFRIDRNRIVFKEQGFWKNGPESGHNNFFLLPVSDRFFKKPLLPRDFTSLALNINKVLPLSDTSCYIVNGPGLVYYSLSMERPVPVHPELPKLKTGFAADQENFCVTPENRIFRILPNGHSAEVPLLQENEQPLRFSTGGVLFIWESGMSSPILFNGRNAWKLKFRNNAIIATLICDVIPLNSYIRCAQYDEQDKILFIGTESKGILMISHNQVQSMRKDQSGLSDRNAYYAQLELPDGNILTNEGHIIGPARTDTASLPIRGKFNFSLTRSGDSLLWYNQTNKTLGYNCLHRYDYRTGQTTVYPKIPVKELAIVTRSGGKTYLATDRGIGVLEGDSMKLLMRIEPGGYVSISYALQELQPGLFAYASCSGLILYNIQNGKTDTLFHESNYCVRTVRIIDGYLFFGTYGRGFFMYKNGQLKAMPVDKNKYLLYAHCFMPDQKGFVWISTNHGLFKASFAELVSAFETNTNSVYYHYFGKNDGMDMTEMNGGCTPCALEMRNGQFSFPTMDGLLWVDPVGSDPILPVGDIYIDEIRVNGIKTTATAFEHKGLPANTNEIELYTGFSAFCNKENIYLEYRINDEPEWRTVNTDGDAIIRLNNLPQGHYRLQIRKRNGFGADNYVYHELQFSIATPWYKSWWFALIMLGMVVAGLILFYRIRTRQFLLNQQRLESIVAQKTKELQEKNEVLEKNDSIKTRLISIISHDIVTPLKFLHAAGKNLLQNRKVIPENLQDETIREMAQTSQDLQLLSTNILNWIKYQNENRRLVRDSFNLSDMVKQVTGVLETIARQKGLQLVNTIDPAMQIHQFHEPLRIVIYNLIMNAINFSEKGEIRIGAALHEDKTASITVADEGAGMTPEQIQHIMNDEYIISSANMDNKKGHGLGYLIIKDLLKMLGGRIDISSARGQGTKVSIILPAEKQKN